MQFTAEDFELPESFMELVQFLPIVVFIGLVAPFLIAAYSLGGVMDILGWLETE
jgi:hypothetical protein